MDSQCSFEGPSSLFQRWNLHMRRLFGHLDASSALSTVPVRKVVLLIRTENSNPWGSARSSRILLNQPEVQAAISKVLSLSRTASTLWHETEFEVHDFARLSFPEQVALMAQTSVFVGVHGAGSSSTVIHCLPLLLIYRHTQE